MSAIDSIYNISNTYLIEKDLKYCFIDENKLPYTINGEKARSNHSSDFVSLADLITSSEADNYIGVGISIQSSNVSAIDVDKCFSKPFDITSGDERAREILEFFKDKTYCEFSFSGKGLRIVLTNNLIEDYNNKYYIKNSKNGIEFYQPGPSYRYVSITGRVIYNNRVNQLDEDIITFLDKYMTRKAVKPIKSLVDKKEDDINKLLKKTKYYTFKNTYFQDLWFGKAPGSGSDESERDFDIIRFIYTYVTQDIEQIRIIFESSPYYKSKDRKHINKWKTGNYRYLNYMYGRIKESEV